MDSQERAAVQPDPTPILPAHESKYDETGDTPQVLPKVVAIPDTTASSDQEDPDDSAAERRAPKRDSGRRRTPRADSRSSSSGRLRAYATPPERSPHGPHPRALVSRRRGHKAQPADETSELPPPSSESSARRRRIPWTGQVHGTGEVSLDQLFGDEPILVVDEMPRDRDLLGGGRRSFRLGMDKALVAGCCALLLLGVSFMVGRSSGNPEEQVVTTSEATGDFPALSISRAFPDAAVPVVQGPAAPAIAPVGGGQTGPGMTPPPPVQSTPSTTQERPRFQIMVMAGIRKQSAEQVKAFLEQHGLAVYLQLTGSRANVRVGGYASRSSEELTRDLTTVHGLSYSGKSLSDAYPVNWVATR
jgi:hypothetical protein